MRRFHLTPSLAVIASVCYSEKEDFWGKDEYFAYDPHDPPVVRKGLPRLFGWKLDRTQGMMVPLITDAEGCLWSDQLESWLVPDEDFLRLYDRENRLRLTRDEALAEKLRSLGINPDEV